MEYLRRPAVYEDWSGVARLISPKAMDTRQILQFINVGLVAPWEDRRR
ncbi:hypothetical protein [Burkholderia pyrrocinia]|nr:hypothetical protein [Burkholderia pyrrocinia]